MTIFGNFCEKSHMAFTLFFVTRLTPIAQIILNFRLKQFPRKKIESQSSSGKK